MQCFSEEKEAEDVVDSDFDIDENDEPVSDHDDEDKQKRKVNTKAYKVTLVYVIMLLTTW